MSGIAVAVGTMKAAQISKPGAGFQIVEREIPEPGAGQVRIKVNACGVCHSDALVALLDVARLYQSEIVTRPSARSLSTPQPPKCRRRRIQAHSRALH